MAASDKSFKQIQTKFKPSQNEKYSKKKLFCQLLAYSDMLGIKSHVRMLVNSLEVSSEPIQNRNKPNQNREYS